jgi:hypothetical protein
VFRKLLALFKDDLMTQSLEGVTELGQGDPYALVTLPYWAWINKQAPAMQILLEARGLNEFDFTWPLIALSRRTNIGQKDTQMNRTNLDMMGFISHYCTKFRGYYREAYSNSSIASASVCWSGLT